MSGASMCVCVCECVCVCVCMCVCVYVCVREREGGGGRESGRESLSMRTTASIEEEHCTFHNNG